MFVIAKPEQQQQKPAQVVKAKKRDAVTPASEFQDSDPEDDEYDKGYVYVISKKKPEIV